LTAHDRQRYNSRTRDRRLLVLLLSLLRARSLSLRVYQADDGEVRGQQVPSSSLQALSSNQSIG